MEAFLCPLCKLRLSFNFHPLAYQEAQEVDQDCFVCLGMLTPLRRPDLIEEVVKQVKSSGYEFESVRLNVTIPGIVLVRDAFAKQGLDSKAVDVKDAFKWVFGPLLAARLGCKFDADANFSVSLVYDTDNNEAELKQLKLIPSAKRRGRKAVKRTRTTLNSISKALGQMSAEVIGSHKASWQVQPHVLRVEVRPMQVECSSSPMYISGSYVKLSRNFSQSPWALDDRKEFEGNVEDVLAAPLKAAYQASTHTFYSSVKPN